MDEYVPYYPNETRHKCERVQDISCNSVNFQHISASDVQTFHLHKGQRSLSMGATGVHDELT